MRTLTACLALLIAFPLLAEEKAEEKVTWQKATLKGMKAEVQFPGKPTTMEGGTMLFLLGKAFYVAAASATSDIDLTDKDEVKKSLDKARDLFTRDLKGKDLKGKVVSEKDIKLGKYPGRAFDIKVAGEIVRARIYLTGTRMYQVTVTGSKELVDGADAKKFLDSLKIEPDPPDGAEAELKKLKGTWAVTRAVREGTEAKPRPGLAFTFDGDKVTQSLPDGRVKGQVLKQTYKVKIDTKKKPHTIELTTESGKTGMVGIYKIEKGRLHLALGQPVKGGKGAVAPKDFSGDDYVAYVMTPEKAKEKAKEKGKE
jgi:uncharacterized protein (TIGR03067 family)